MIEKEYNALQDAVTALSEAETKTRGKACLELIGQAVEHIAKACEGWDRKQEREA